MNWAWYNLFIFLTWRWEDKSRQTQDLPKISSSMSGRWKEEPRRRNTEVTLPQHPGLSRRVCCSSTVNYWIEWRATGKRLGKYSKRKKLNDFLCLQAILQGAMQSQAGGLPVGAGSSPSLPHVVLHRQLGALLKHSPTATSTMQRWKEK